MAVKSLILASLKTRPRHNAAFTLDGNSWYYNFAKNILKRFMRRRAFDSNFCSQTFPWTFRLSLCLHYSIHAVNSRTLIFLHYLSKCYFVIKYDTEKIYDKKAINKRKVGYQGESASGDESSHPIRFCRCWRAFHRKESFVRQQYEIFPFMLSIVATFFSILDENNGDGISRMKTQLFPPRNLYFNE